MVASEQGGGVWSQGSSGILDLRQKLIVDNNKTHPFIYSTTAADGASATGAKRPDSISTSANIKLFSASEMS